MFSLNDILPGEFQFNKKMSDNILNWKVEKVAKLFQSENIESSNNLLIRAINEERIDGKTLLLLNERDIADLKLKYGILLGDLKRLTLIVHKLQNENRNCLLYLGLIDKHQNNLLSTLVNSQLNNQSHQGYHHQSILNERSNHQIHDVESISPSNSVDGVTNNTTGKFIATCIRPEFFKTIVSCGKLIDFFY